MGVWGGRHTLEGPCTTELYQIILIKELSLIQIPGLALFGYSLPYNTYLLQRMVGKHIID